jgi:hypothetical protein
VSHPPQLTTNAQAGYAATLFYAPMTLSIKLSLLTLIARIFAPYKRKVQGIYALGAILIIYYMTSWILKIRICAPISAYWRLETDKCLDQSAIILGDSIVSTITDAIILVLPLPLTWSLQIPNEKKLRVGGMLAVGGLATAFSAWRLHLLRTDGASQDATILFVQIVLSGFVQASHSASWHSTNNISQQRRSRPRPNLHLSTSLRRPVPTPRKRRTLRLVKKSKRDHQRRQQSRILRLTCLRYIQDRVRD